MNNFIVIIPARLKSTRLAEKALAQIENKTMVEWTHYQALQSGAKRVIVATDHPRIAQVIEKNGGEVCMTNENHSSGTSRIVEVVEKLELNDDEIIVNLQGDLPKMSPQNISQVANILEKNNQAALATLIKPFPKEEDLANPNVVKVVIDRFHQALYFSRSIVPFTQNPENHLQHYFYHIGIYAYRAGFLKQLSQLLPSPYESLESLEQLKVLWHGFTIQTEIECADSSFSVDTQSDLEKMRTAFAKEMCVEN